MRCSNYYVTTTLTPFISNLCGPCTVELEMPYEAQKPSCKECLTRDREVYVIRVTNSDNQYVLIALCEDCIKTKYKQCRHCGNFALKVKDYRDKKYCGMCYSTIVYPPLTGKQSPWLKFEEVPYDMENIHFGIEMECVRKVGYSFSNEFVDSFPNWGWTRDSSIKFKEDEYSVEFISCPLSGEVGLNELNRFLAFLKEKDFKVNNTCGFHVHVDARQLSWTQMRNVAIAWQLIQPYVFAKLPQGRSKCKHCKPLNIPLSSLMAAETDEQIFGLIYNGERLSREALTQKRIRKYNDARYYALNLHSFFYKKTLEFRVFPASTNFNRVESWVNLVKSIVVNGRQSKYWTQSTLFDKLGERVVKEFDLKIGRFPVEPEPKKPEPKPKHAPRYFTEYIPVENRWIIWEDSSTRFNDE